MNALGFLTLGLASDPAAPVLVPYYDMDLEVEDRTDLAVTVVDLTEFDVTVED